MIGSFLQSFLSCLSAAKGTHSIPVYGISEKTHRLDTLETVSRKKESPRAEPKSGPEATPRK